MNGFKMSPDFQKGFFAGLGVIAAIVLVGLVMRLI